MTQAIETLSGAQQIVARTGLGLGTMATQAASSVAITGGAVTGITDITVADGGTGASTAADARTNLGLGTLATQSGTFSGTSSGTNTGDQTITLSGDVTGSGTGSFATTIAAGAVDIAMLSATGTPSGSTFLRGDNSWATPAGSGDVSKVGTPVNNQVGVWTGDGTIEGATNFTYDGVNLQVTGDIGSTGTRITKGWFTDFQVTNAIAGSVTGNAATVTTNANLTGHVTSTGNAAVLGAFTVAQLNTAISDGTIATGGGSATGTNTGDNATNSQYSGLVTNATHDGDATGATTLTLATVNANVGAFGSATQASQVTVNAKGLVTAAANVTVTPAIGSVTGLGTGVGTALAVNIGTAGAPIVNGGALGTPSSGTATNVTGLPIDAGTTGTLTVARGGTNLTAVGTALQVLRTNAGATALEFATLAGGGNAQTADPLSQFATTTSSQLAGVISDKTGTGALVFATSPTLVTPALGTVASGNVAACTGYTFANIATKPTTLSGYGITDAALLTSTSQVVRMSELKLYDGPVEDYATITATDQEFTFLDATGAPAPVTVGLTDLARLISPSFTTPALGTPSSGTLTSCTGLPISGLVASTSLAIGVGSVELGHASDTTISRTGAGDIAVEGNAVYRAGGTDVPVADGGTGASTAADARTNLQAASRIRTISVGLVTTSTGLKVLLPDIPFAGTIISWRLVSDVSGSAVIDIWKANASVPTNGNSITASAKPTLTAAQRATSSTLTGWTTTVAVGDVFGFEVESATTATFVTLVLEIQETHA